MIFNYDLKFCINFPQALCLNSVSYFHFCFQSQNKQKGCLKVNALNYICFLILKSITTVHFVGLFKSWLSILILNSCFFIKLFLSQMESFHSCSRSTTKHYYPISFASLSEFTLTYMSVVSIHRPNHFRSATVVIGFLETYTQMANSIQPKKR